MTTIIKTKILSPEAKTPTRGSAEAAGYDLYSIERCSLQPYDREIVRTGIALEIPPGFEGQIRPRSGLAFKHGVTVLNAPGTIDADYRGEVKVMLTNQSNVPVCINPGDRIAQLVISKLSPVEFVTVSEDEDLQDSTRGPGGFGSTGR